VEKVRRGKNAYRNLVRKLILKLHQSEGAMISLQLVEGGKDYIDGKLILEENWHFIITSPEDMMNGKGTWKVKKDSIDHEHLRMPRKKWFMDIASDFRFSINHSNESGDGKSTGEILRGKIHIDLPKVIQCFLLAVYSCSLQ